MQTDTILTEITSMATSLVAQKTLRSKAVLLNRLMPLIDEAIKLGHKHEAIHSAIESAGVELTFGYYRNTLHRLRTRIASVSGPVVTHDPGRISASTGSDEPVEIGSKEPNVVGSQEPKETLEQKKPRASDSSEALIEGDVFAVRDALKEAQLVSQTDYRKRARLQGKQEK